MKSSTRYMIPALLALGALTSATLEQSAEMTAHFIVQGQDMAAVTVAVSEAGGSITHRLDIIRAVGAELTPSQQARIGEALPGVRFHANAAAEITARKSKGSDAPDESPTEEPTGEAAGDDYTGYPALIGADRLHAEGITGRGVTVAVVDTGIYSGPGLSADTSGSNRIIYAYDATTDTAYHNTSKRHGLRGLEEFDNDTNGHGSHVASAGFNSKLSNVGKYNGIAPDVRLVSIKVFDDEGRGTYADVIRGVSWAVDHRDELGIDVLNMSLSAMPQSSYWEDPLNQAVMAAWEAGIVVVASAGNTGPDPHTIGVPGNVPYIISVGAMTDNGTPDEPADDRLAAFSAAGPTYEGFVKPEVVAPGGQIMAAMESDSVIAMAHPEFHDGASFFSMSGTSQATALVSGIAALLLDADPTLTPDAVKCRIMAGAKPAVDATGRLAYSIFQQGAGLVNAYNAVYSTAQDCANGGLDVSADVAGEKHFGGRANIDQNGTYYLMGMAEHQWNAQPLSENGYLWSDGYLWSNGYLWSSGYLWTDTHSQVAADGYLWRTANSQASGYLWSDGYLWADGYLWSDTLTEPMSINVWVEP